MTFQDVLNTIKSGVDTILGKDTPMITPVDLNMTYPQGTIIDGYDYSGLKKNQGYMPRKVNTFDDLSGYINGQIPEEISPLIKKNSIQYEVPAPLIASGLMTESGFNKNAFNSNLMDNGQVSTDRGMAQINDYWNPQVTDEQAYDPEFAVNFIAKYLADKYKEYNDWNQAVASYNVGNRVGPDPSRDEMGLGPKGREYLNKIVKNLSPELISVLGMNSTYQP